MSISTQYNVRRDDPFAHDAVNKNAINDLNARCDKILVKFAKLGEHYDNINNTISGVLQTVNEKINSFLDMKEITDEKTASIVGKNPTNLSFVRTIMNTFDAVTGVLSVASELNKDIKSGNKNYDNSMFAITKSTTQTILTMAAATAVTGLLVGVVSGGIALAAAAGAGAGVGYLAGKSCDWLRENL